MIYELYQRRWLRLGRLQWSWRLKARNGKTIAVSGESYNNEGDARSAIDLVRGSAQIAIRKVEK